MSCYANGVELEQRLSAMLGPRVSVETIAIDAAAIRALFPEERAEIARAVLKRQQEYASGRVLARRLLARLGVEDRPLLAGSDRAPIWPEGVVGSISHAGEMCAVAIARAGEVLAVGIDIEEDAPLAAELEKLVLRERERALLAGLPPHQRGAMAKLFFSAKEAVYKCQHPLTRTMLEFEEVELELSLATESFEARVLHPKAQDRFRGRYAFAGGYVATTVVRERT